MRAIHVVAGLDPAIGGLAYSVPRLCRALAAAGAEAELLAVAEIGCPPASMTSQGVSGATFKWDYGRVPVIGQLRCSTGLATALRGGASGANVIHDHGIWLMPNLRAAWAARAAGRPLVVSPRGMLSPEALSFSRWKKRAVWALLQGPAARTAACLHATSEQEYAEIRACGLSSPVAIIPNGIDLPDSLSVSSPPPRGQRTVLSLGRLHPKKGLDRLVRAWAEIEARHPDWRLRIVGPAEQGHDRVLGALVSELGLARVSIEGPIYDDHKIAAYRDANLFVLSTLNENFGLTVAEALAAGTPVVSTKGAPWQGLESERCGWWIDHGVAPLAAALDEAMTLPREALKERGARGRAWMARDFSWARVGADMLAVYQWLCCGAPAPATVRLD